MADNNQEQEQKQQNQEENQQNSFQSMQAQIDQYVTDPGLIAQIDKDQEQLSKDVTAENELELFKIKFDNLHNALKQSYNNESHFIKQCRDHSVELTSLLAKLEGVQKMTLANEENVQITRVDLERVRTSIDDQKQLKIDIEEKIKRAKEEYNDLTLKADERLRKVDQENIKLLKDLRKAKEDIEKKCEVQQQRMKYLNDENDYVDKEVHKEENSNAKYNKEVSQLNDDIKQIKEDTIVAEKTRDEMQKEIDEIKEKIDDANEEHAKKLETLRQLKDVYEQLPLKNTTLQKEKDLHNENNKKLDKSIKDITGEIQENYDKYEKYIENIKGLDIETDSLKNELKSLEKSVVESMKEKKIMHKRLNKLITQKENLERERDSKIEREKIEQHNVDTKKKFRDKQKEDFDGLIRARSQANKDLKKAEDEDHNMDGEIIYGQNKVRKIENQVFGYQAENEKLRKIITQLQKEQEKYGIEASQAHAKYYQTIEEVKIKNNQITELQKKNAEVEAKLKHQQNLYEAVRSDRNLYSKNLLESQEEKDELQKKYTRMTHQVDQFKEEIKQKSAAIVKEDFEFNKIVEENKTTKLQKKRVKKAIKSTEEVIKSQEGHLSRLKYVMQESKQEKQRNSKDLDMVINERDILGTQLIKRNHELNVLYEKIKLNQSNLAKGEIFYREKQRELDSLKSELTLLINELKGTQEQISCTDELKAEINSLEKDILQAKTKVKALQDELENPLNVHRWRKLEATDQELFEKILKIQTLQRRLIAKTEEVKEKDNLIKEKEKLFMELKNILARQPGSEIHQQLAQYKESLKEKQGQMKKMNNELKNAKDSVDILKFENQRLRDEMATMKKKYFQKRKQQDFEQQSQQSQQQQQSNQQGNGIIYDQYNPQHNPDLQGNQGIQLGNV